MSKNNWIKTVLYVSFFLIVPNVFFNILSHFIYTKGALIDIDYLVLGFLFYYIPFILGFLLLFLIFALDTFFTIIPGFHFTDVNIIRSLEHILHMNVFDLSILVFFVLVVFYFISKAINKIKTKTGAWACLIVLLVVLGIDMVLGKKAEIYFSTDHFSTSLINNFRKIATDLKDSEQIQVKGSMPAASDLIAEPLSVGDIPSRVVYIVLESIAEFTEEAANDLQWRAFNNEQVQNSYEIQTGSVAFKGTTVPAELRELCRLEFNTINPDLTEIAVENCLVEQFKEHGFHTQSYHPFTGLFFNRYEWYPLLGFDDMFFVDDLDRKVGRKRCSPTSYFDAACDESVLTLIHAQLLDVSHDKAFIYWLTLNTHLPLDPLDLNPEFCALSHTTSQHKEICDSVQMHDDLFSSIVEVMLDPNLPPTLFILVGDHAPPFLSVDLRDAIDQKHVPYMIVWPKNAI